MAKPKIVLREWIEEGKVLASYMDTSPTLREYDPHKISSVKLADGWALFDGKETFDSLTYLQLIIDGKEDGIYKAKEMAFDKRYDVFLDGLKRIEAEKNRPEPFIMGFRLTGESLYKRVSELALNCFKERRK
jgi:hypothetical protein